MLYGCNEDIPFVRGRSMKSLFQTWESLYWIFPKEQAYNDETIVTLDNKDYSMSNFDDLLDKVGLQTGIKYRQKYSLISVESPGVKHFPIYGSGVKTIFSLKFPEKCGHFKTRKGLDCTPDIRYESGDSTLLAQSVIETFKWNDTIKI